MSTRSGGEGRSASAKRSQRGATPSKAKRPPGASRARAERRTAARSVGVSTYASELNGIATRSNAPSSEGDRMSPSTNDTLVEKGRTLVGDDAAPGGGDWRSASSKLRARARNG